jgi:hypothetical protein
MKTMNGQKWKPSKIQPCAALMYCGQCDQHKLPHEFSLYASAPQGRVDILSSPRSSSCKHCQNTAYMQYDPRRKMLYAARSRARQSGIECTITVDDIEIPELCPALGIPLRSTLGQGSLPPNKLYNSPSLDRVDNSKGYIPGNVRVISMRANDLKRNATAEELEGVARYIRQHLNQSTPTT